MGYTLDATGKPTITATPLEVDADIQGAIDYAERVGGLLKGTNADRLAMTSAQSKVGWLFSETDTGALYRRMASGWEPYASFSHVLTGSAVPGINLAAAVERPRPPLIKSGRLTFFTTVAFGNEYAPTVTFAQAFPNGVTSVSLTQIAVSSDSVVADRTIAVDSVGSGSFRAIYPGGTTVTKRAFLWRVEGH